MAKESFLGGAVPVPRATRPLDVPQNTETADIILKSAQLSQGQDELELKSRQQLADAITTMANLMQKKRETDLDELKGNALIDLMNAQASAMNRGDVEVIDVDGKSAIKYSTKSGTQVKFAPMTSENRPLPGSVSADISLANEAVTRIRNIQNKLFKDGKINTDILSQINAPDFSLPFIGSVKPSFQGADAQEVDADLGKVLEVDTKRVTGAQAAAAQTLRLKKQFTNSIYANPEAGKRNLAILEKALVEWRDGLAKGRGAVPSSDVLGLHGTSKAPAEEKVVSYTGKLPAYKGKNVKIRKTPSGKWEILGVAE